MVDLPPMLEFRDISVVPVSAAAQHIALGGPIWPAFDQQRLARHCRDQVAVDACPAGSPARRTLRSPAIWGGFLDLQFGHLIVEQLTRLPQSLRDRPDDICLFTLPPGQTEATLPDWVWQCLDWHGLPRRRVKLVSAPLRVVELRVAAQGEMMGKHLTSDGYLDLLDANWASRALVPAVSDVVFVTRAGLVSRGQGGHAGESYLAEVLIRAGVQVIDPARHAVAAQLAIYAGARVLVFSEGSAIHGRLLLGRIAQDIHILRRRPNRDLASPQLAPRCRVLRYHAAVGHRLGARMRGGNVRQDLSPALYDLKVVFDLFGSLGYDLPPLWNDMAYRDAVLHDMHGWLVNCRTDPEQRHDNIRLLAATGFAVSNSPLPPTLPSQGQTLH